jgi:hypothetical protein
MKWLLLVPLGLILFVGLVFYIVATTWSNHG